jgi:hypothetical protein
VSILVRFAPQDLATDKYDEVIRRLESEGDFPPEGLEFHVCFRPEGQVAVSEVWESKEQFEAFGERLMPILSDAGIDPGEPSLIEVHNTIGG